MISPEFGIPVLPGRLDGRQVEALDVAARLVMWLMGTANAERGTWYVNLREFSGWAACSERQAARALDSLEASGWVRDVKRRAHGMSGSLGAMWRRRGDVDTTMPARVYQRVFGLRAHGDDRQRMRYEIGTAAGDLKLWAGVCQEWRGAKHNPGDVEGLLECYARKRKAARTVLEANFNKEPDYSGYQGGKHEPGE